METPPVQRDFAAEYAEIERRQEALAAEKNALCDDWATDLEARMRRLVNPETGRAMTPHSMINLIPGYETSRPQILYNALSGQDRSRKLLMALEETLTEMEGDPRFKKLVNE